MCVCDVSVCSVYVYLCNVELYMMPNLVSEKSTRGMN